MKMLAEWAVTSSILILIVTALRALLKKRLSARARYALWAVVLVRLLVPVQLPGLRLPVSAAAAVPQAPPPVQTQIPLLPLERVPLERAPIPAPAPADSAPGAVTTNAAGRPWQADPDGQTATRYWAAPTAAQLLAGLWGLGAAALGGVLLASNVRFGRGLRRRRQALEEDSPIPVYADRTLDTSFLFGVSRPGVYLNGRAAQDGEVRRHVLAHELTHYAHRDHLWSALRCVCLALHWYNPLVWLAALLSRRDGELACDEGAVVRLGEAERLRYGRTLVDLAAEGRGRWLRCSTAMGEGGKTLQQRIAALVEQPRTGLAAGLAAAVVVMGGALFAFACRDVPETGLRTEFLNRLEGASLVHVHRPILFSYAFPPVAAPDLAARAKGVLGELQPLAEGDTPPQGALDDPYGASVSFSEDGGPLYALNRKQAEGRYYLQLREEDGTWSPVGVLPGDTVERLFDLTESQAERNVFARRLEEAERIRMEEPPASGRLSPPAIEEEEALARARDLLSRWQRWDDSPLPAGKPGWEELWITSDRIALGAEEEWNQYYLSQGEDYRFLFTRWSAGEDGDHHYTLVGVLPGETADTLKEVARQQGGGEEAFRAALEQMTSLNVFGGMLSSWLGPAIADEDLVAEARALLGSADLDSGTAGPAQLYHDASFTLCGPEGEVLYQGSLNDRAVAAALESLSREQARRQMDPTPLTPEELKQFEELLLGTEEFNPLIQFLQSQYSDAREVDLYQLFYTGGMDGIAYASLEERQAVIKAGYDGFDPEIPCMKITPAEMDRMLKRYTGLTLAETGKVNLDGFTYLPQYDAYFAFRSDTNYVPLDSFRYGTRSGNRVWLWYDGLHMLPGAQAVWVLSLEQVGGDYLIRANESLEVHNARMAGDAYPGYEMLGAAAFAAALRVQDVASVTLEKDGARAGGPTGPDLETLKEQLTDALGRTRFETEFDQTRHGRYQVTVRVRDGDGRENTAPEYRLLLSAGDSEDDVYLEHQDWNGHVFHTFVISRELYRTILDLF